jgi:hypothetical protein
VAVTVPISLRDPHRLIPAKYAEKSVLEQLQLDRHVTRDLSELDAVTNERKIAEAGNSPSIGPQELLYGVTNVEGLALWLDSNFQSMEHRDPAWKAGRFGKRELLSRDQFLLVTTRGDGLETIQAD